jgi:nitrous oxidase accessory protein NosD
MSYDKKDYKFWCDSSILADEWVDTINLTLQSMKVVDDDDKEPSIAARDGSVSKGNFIVQNSYGADITDENDVDEEEKLSNLEETLFQASISDKDGFDIQSYTISQDYSVHEMLRPTKWIVEPYKRRKVRNQSQLTLEKAILDAQPGDVITVKSGQHFVTRTIVIDRSIELVGEKGTQIIMLQEQEGALSVAQPLFCVIAPYVKMKSIEFKYACVLTEDADEVVPEGLDDFVIDSRAVTSQLLNANMDTIVIHRQTIGVTLAKAVVQIARGQIIIENCKFNVMASTLTEKVIKAYDGMFISGSSQVLLNNCEFSDSKHGISVAVQSSLHAKNCTVRNTIRHGIVVTQRAKIELESCQFVNNRCGVCLLNQAHATISKSTFKSSTCTTGDDSKFELIENTFSHDSETPLTSMIVCSGASSGTIRNNTIACRKPPSLCVCLTDNASVQLSHNQFKKEGTESRELVYVTGKAKAIVPDEKHSTFKCFEQGSITVGSL